MRSRKGTTWTTVGGPKRSLAELAERGKPNPQCLRMRDGNEYERVRMCEVRGAGIEGPGEESNCRESEKRLEELAEAEK